MIGPRLRALGGGVRAGWSRFWFTPTPGATLALWRCAAGWTALAWFLALGLDLVTFFGESGLRPDPYYGDHRIGVLQWVGGDRMLWGLYVSGVLSSGALIVGRWVRPAALVVAYAVVSIQLDNSSILNAGDILLRIWLVYFALFALVTPSRILGIRVFGAPASDGSRSYPSAPTWFLRLVQIQLTIIYPAGLFHKLDGSTWRHGTAALYALGLEDFERFPVPEFLRTSLIAGWVLTYLTLAIECTVPFLLWNRRTRRFAICAGLALHLGFDYALRVGFFAWAMTLGYVAFLTPTESATIVRWVRSSATWRPLVRRRRPVLEESL